MTIIPKFEINSPVWMMKDNVIEQTTVDCILIAISKELSYYTTSIKIEIKYTLSNGLKNIPESKKLLFSTKDELVQNLLKES